MDWMWIIIAAFASALPLPVIKFYAETGNFLWIVGAAILYAILIYAYYKVVKDASISRMYPIVKIISIFVVVFAGLLLFHEKLGWLDGLGILLGVGAIYLLSR